MVSQAKNAPDDLDIVFFGDNMIEHLSGTRGLGLTTVDGMDDYFEQKFSKRHGGEFNAIALGSSGDTVGFKHLFRSFVSKSFRFVALLL